MPSRAEGSESGGWRGEKGVLFCVSELSHSLHFARLGFIGLWWVNLSDVTSICLRYIIITIFLFIYF
jgi:hypothetical protein